MRTLQWMLLPAIAAMLTGCAPTAGLHFAAYDKAAAPTGAMLKIDFEECYSEIRGSTLRVVCRQHSIRTKDPLTGKPLTQPFTEEVLGGLEIELKPADDWQGIRPVTTARFQYINTRGGGWICRADSGHVQFGGVFNGKLGIRFGLRCDRVGPPAPDPKWVYREVSGLLTPEVNPAKVAKLWPRVFHDGE